MRKSGIGKGLSQLIGENLQDTEGREVPLDRIVPNSRQPRRRFEEAPLQELADSIRIHGVLSPLLVRPVGDERYELIAGERRFRAAGIAGLETVPVRILAVAGEASLEIAIIENVQREDISAAESAHAYRRLMDEFGLTQDQIAERVGKARSSIANTLRLLKLPTPMLDSLQEGKMTEGHARALLGFADESRRELAYRAIIANGSSVREVERMAQDTRPPERARQSRRDAVTEHVEGALEVQLGSPVRIRRYAKGGMITISFSDEEDLARIVEKMGAAE